MEQCDSCPARASQRYTSPDGSTLTFCSHHSLKFVVSLSHQGFVAVDEYEPAGA